MPPPIFKAGAKSLAQSKSFGKAKSFAQAKSKSFAQSKSFGKAKSSARVVSGESWGKWGNLGRNLRAAAAQCWANQGSGTC